MTESPNPADVRYLVHSGALFSGVAKGYALILTGDRVIGCKEFTEGHLVASAPLDAEATKALQSLLGHQEFSVPYGEVQAVTIKAPGKLKPGAFTFRTAAGEHTVKIGGSFGSRFSGVSLMLEMVTGLLQEVMPGRVDAG